MRPYKQNYYLLTKFIEAVGLCKPEQLNSYLSKLNIPKNIQQSLIKTAISQRNIKYDGHYFTTDSYADYTMYTPSLEKAIWYFVDKCDKFNFFNFHPLIPSSLYLMNNNPYEKMEDLTVFYIPKGTEGITTRIIETNYGGMQSIINTVLIVDDFSQCDNIVLSEIFNVKEIVTVSKTGEIKSF